MTIDSISRFEPELYEEALAWWRHLEAQISLALAEYSKDLERYLEPERTAWRDAELALAEVADQVDLELVGLNAQPFFSADLTLRAAAGSTLPPDQTRPEAG